MQPPVRAPRRDPPSRRAKPQRINRQLVVLENVQAFARHRVPQSRSTVPGGAVSRLVSSPFNLVDSESTGTHVAIISFVLAGRSASGHHPTDVTECLCPISTTAVSAVPGSPLDIAAVNVELELPSSPRTRHTRAVMSSAHDTRCVPAALHLIWFTSLVWPLCVVFRVSV